MNIPKYKTVAGLVLPRESIIKGETQCIIQSTMTAEVRAYAEQLEACGFTKYAEREIPAGTEKPNTVNLSYTYIREDMHIFVFFSGALRMALVSASLPGALPGTEKPQYIKRAIPSVTQCGVKNGMCFAAQAADGSFILMDGGTYCREDAAQLYAFMQEKTPGGEKPRVALWLFSHPDSDHVQLAAEFLREYGEKVEVAAVAYQFPDLCKVQFTYQNTAQIMENEEALEASIRQNCPDAVHYALHPGQVYYFPGLEMEILWTGELLYPYSFMTANDCSAAWRMRFDSGRTALFLGDCMHDACRRMAHTYGDYMKSDIFQLTHHGLIGGDKGLYQQIDPEVCLWATGKDRFAGRLEGQKYQWCIGEGECDYNAWIRDDAVRKREHYHNGETTTLLFE